jgi:hypothetical protein
VKTRVNDMCRRSFSLFWRLSDAVSAYGFHTLKLRRKLYFPEQGCTRPGHQETPAPRNVPEETFAYHRAQMRHPFRKAGGLIQPDCANDGDGDARVLAWIPCDVRLLRCARPSQSGLRQPAPVRGAEDMLKIAREKCPQARTALALSLAN